MANYPSPQFLDMIMAPNGSLIPRSRLAMIGDRVNVKNYGVKGDGITQDATAIAAVVAAFPNRQLYFPRGNYLIGSNTNLGNSQQIIGEGENNTVFTATGTGYDCFTLTSDDATISNVGFQSSAYRTGGAYININGATRSNRISHVKMYNGFKGILLSGTPVITIIDNVEILNCNPVTGVGIHIQGGNDTFITHAIMDNAGGALQPFAGVWIQSTQATWMTDCDLIRSGSCLLIEPQTAGTDVITWCFFNQVACDTSTLGIGVRPIVGTSVRGLTFINCWGSTNSTNGVTIDGGGLIDGVQFIGGRFLNNGGSGAVVAASLAINVDFIDCITAGNSQNSVGLYSGFDIAANISKFRIINCISGQVLGFANTQNRGILVNAGTSANYVITGNNLSNNVNAGMVNNGSGSSVVAGNQGYVTQNSGSSTIAIGQSVVTITHGMSVTPNIQDISVAMSSSPSVSSVTTIWVTAVGATTFQIVSTTNVAGTALSVIWQIRSNGA